MNSNKAQIWPNGEKLIFSSIFSCVQLMPEHLFVLPGPRGRRSHLQRQPMMTSPKTAPDDPHSFHTSVTLPEAHRIPFSDRTRQTCNLYIVIFFFPSIKFPPVTLCGAHPELICRLPWRFALICFLTATVQQKVQMSMQLQELLSGGQASIFHKLMVSFVLLTIAKNGRIYVFLDCIFLYSSSFA